MAETPKKECPYPGEADAICRILVDEVVAAGTWEHIKSAAVGLSKVRGVAERLSKEWAEPAKNDPPPAQ